MTVPKGAAPALRLTLPGAAKEWHHFGGIDGLYHPDYAVPLDVLGISDADARALVKEKGALLALEQASAEDAKAARAAYAKQLGAPVADQAAPTPEAAPAVVPDTPKEG